MCKYLQMGELFKVMCVTQADIEAAPLGWHPKATVLKE